VSPIPEFADTHFVTTVTRAEQCCNQTDCMEGINLIITKSKNLLNIHLYRKTRLHTFRNDTKSLVILRKLNHISRHMEHTHVNTRQEGQTVSTNKMQLSA
jgi:hypothetical protein